MESQLYSEKLQIFRGTVKEDAIKFSIFCAAFLIYLLYLSLLTTYFEFILWGVFLYLPFLFAAFLGFICSKTHNKSFLGCYSFTLVIIAIYFGVLIVIAVASIIKFLSFECDDESCSLSQYIYKNVAFWLMILGLLWIASFVFIIYALGHSNKMKGLLSHEMKEYQVPLMVQQGITTAYPIYQQQANENYFR